MKTYGRVKHPTGEEDTGDVNEVVATTSDTSGERSETNGGGLSDDDPRSGSRSEGEEDGNDETESSLGVGVDGRLDVANGSGDTKSNKENSVSKRTPEVDASSTKVRCQDPRKHDKDSLESRGDKTHGEGSLGGHTSLLEEVDGLVGNQVTSQVLGSVNAADDEGTVEIGATEELEQARLLDSLLEIDGTLHHGNGLVGVVDLGGTSETANRLGGFLETALSNQPPRRLGREEDEDGERSREHPLESNGNSESSLLVKVVVVEGNSTDDNSTNSPEHLQHLSSRSTKLKGHNLGTVSRRVGDENTPWDTLKELSDQHESEGVSEVEDEDEGVEEHETTNSGPSVSDSAGDRTSDGDTDNGTQRTTNLKSGLPASLDNVFILFCTPDTVSVGESGKGDEVTNQEDTVRLHDLHIISLRITQCLNWG